VNIGESSALVPLKQNAGMYGVVCVKFPFIFGVVEFNEIGMIANALTRWTNAVPRLIAHTHSAVG
jgi:hypothetical protein